MVIASNDQSFQLTFQKMFNITAEIFSFVYKGSSQTLKKEKENEYQTQICIARCRYVYCFCTTFIHVN